jgi:hypothetical protein
MSRGYSEFYLQRVPKSYSNWQTKTYVTGNPLRRITFHSLKALSRLAGKTEAKRPLGRPGSRWDVNILMQRMGIYHNSQIIFRYCFLEKIGSFIFGALKGRYDYDDYKEF